MSEMILYRFGFMKQDEQKNLIEQGTLTLCTLQHLADLSGAVFWPWILETHTGSVIYWMIYNIIHQMTLYVSHCLKVILLLTLCVSMF